MSNHPKVTALRRHAEEVAQEQSGRSPEDLEALTPEQAGRMLHELRVHQIELEMQNEELRRAQAELDETRARYFDLYDLAPVGYCTVSEQGLILEVNLTVATLLGVSRSELVRQPISRFILKADQDTYYLHSKRIFETPEPQECELRLLKSDGALFWAHLTGAAAQAEDGAPVCRVVLSDITERKQAEEALRDSEARFRHLLQGVPNVAVQGYGADGTTRYWNEASEHLYGYTAQEAIGRNLIDLIIPTEMRGEVEQAIQQMAATGQPIPASEVSLMRKDGSRVCVFSSHATVQMPGQAPELFCIDIDITERKRAEAALREHEQMVSAIVESSQDWIWAIDRNGRHTYSNRAVESILGYSPAEFHGLGLDLVHPDDKPLVEAEWPGWVEERRGWRNKVLRWRANDGTYRHLESTAVPILDPQGELLGFRGVDRDITERKRAEKQLQQHVEDLRVRNDALTRFNAVTVDRELRMIELKREVNELCLKLGEPPRHKVVSLPQPPEAVPEDRV